MQTAAPPMPILKRSKRRWFFVGGFVLVLLATPFVYLMVATYWQEQELEQIYREMDAEDPHWRWADLVKQMPPVPPDERNAMVQMVKVGGLLKGTRFRAGPLWDKRLPVNARLTDANELLLRTALGALPPTALAEAVKLKDLSEGGISPDVKIDLTKLLNVTNLLDSAVALHCQRSEYDDAADACLAITHSAHSLREVPILMSQLVRMAMLIHAVRAIERTLGQGVLSEDRLDTIQKALAVEAASDGVWHALRGERAFGHEFHIALRDGKADQLVSQLHLDRSFRGKLFQLFPRMLLQGYPNRLRLQNEIVRASKMKDVAQIDALSKIDIKPDQADPLLRGWKYTLDNINQMRSDQTRVRCAVAAIAAERYRLTHDQWPAGIAELVKEGLLKQPITDPFDGQPLRFRGSETGLIVYSIGSDQIDNQGKSGDIRFELWLPTFRATAPLAEVEAPKAKRR